MKIVFLLFFSLVNNFAAIYGPDDRTIVPIDSQKKAVFAQLADNRYEIVPNGLVIHSRPLQEHVTNLCTSERFALEPSFSRCTAFLIGDNLILTAGHCVNNQEECERRIWVLSQEVSGEEGEFIPSENLIKCEKLIDQKKNSASKNDYALIQIKTSQSLPRPFKFSKSNPFLENQRDKKFYILGHPSGLPLIDSGPAKIIDDTSEFIFFLDSDTFGGNSGSPVIDQESGDVFGILTNGDLDYKLNPERGCLETYKCLEGNTCKGESVVPIYNIPFLVPGPKSREPIFDPRTRSL